MIHKYRPSREVRQATPSSQSWLGGGSAAVAPRRAGMELAAPGTVPLHSSFLLSSSWDATSLPPLSHPHALPDSSVFDNADALPAVLQRILEAKARPSGCPDRVTASRPLPILAACPSGCHRLPARLRARGRVAAAWRNLPLQPAVGWHSMQTELPTISPSTKRRGQPSPGARTGCGVSDICPPWV